MTESDKLASDGFDQPIRVLALSTLFPNEVQPRHGIFLQHRLAHLAHEERLQIQVVAPVPWFPSAHPAFGRYAAFRRVPTHEERCGLSVLHARYPVLPKIGETVAPILMAAALLPRLLAIRKSGFDFDVIDSYVLYPDGVATALLGLLLNRPVVLTAFGTDVNYVPRNRLARAQILWAVAQAAGTTTVCHALKVRLVELGAVSDSVEVILHGVDKTLFTPPVDLLALRSAMGFDRPTLVSIGHLIKRKGHDLAIKALVDLPSISLIIAGDGPEEAALKCLAVEHCVADRVTFLGHVDQSKLPALMGAADALVLCSDREGIANVLMEALACGTPVAATPVWGSPEVVTTPEAGVLLRDRSVGALVEGVRNLLERPPDRIATRSYAERFSWSDTAARHAKVIRSAVATSPSWRHASRMRLL